LNYIKLEESIRIKKIKYSKLKAELELQLIKEKKGMLDNNGEIFNHNGISREATLNINLLEAQNLPSWNFQGLSDPFVVFSLEAQKSKSAYKSNTLDPVWNENFNFQPSSKNSVLNIEVWSKGNLYAADALLGKTQIFLENHIDQKKNILNLDLNNNIYQSRKSMNILNKQNNLINNNNTYIEEKEGNFQNNLENTATATIHFSLQFIWNKLKYYTDNYNEIEKKINILQKYIEELNVYCENFNKPFGLIISGNLLPLIEKKILDKDSDYNLIVDDNRSKSKMITSPRQTNTKYSFTNKLHNVIKSTISNKMFFYYLFYNRI